jgi:hypothetical protein
MLKVNLLKRKFSQKVKNAQSHFAQSSSLNVYPAVFTSNVRENCLFRARHIAQLSAGSTRLGSARSKPLKRFCSLVCSMLRHFAQLFAFFFANSFAHSFAHSCDVLLTFSTFCTL